MKHSVILLVVSGLLQNHILKFAPHHLSRYDRLFFNMQNIRKKIVSMDTEKKMKGIRLKFGFCRLLKRPLRDFFFFKDIKETVV